jgi:hypothetical protein
MSLTYEFYVQRAEAAQSAADQATLDNVRDRELRSANAWRTMADRQLMIEAERIKADEVRAERRAAEREAAGREALPKADPARRLREVWAD